MDIIVGRESGVAEPRLCLKFGNNVKYIGVAGSVPKSVSRNHCVISIDDDNNLSVKNVSDMNALYVNGLEYKTKSVTETDLIELGPEKYRLDLAAAIKAVKSNAPKPAAPAGTPEVKSYNISPLKKIWGDYTQAKLDIQIRERKLGAMSAVPGIISTMSVILGLVGKSEGLRILFFIVAVIGAVACALIRIKSAGNVPLLHKELDEKFQDNYVCPHCSHFLGNQRYELVLRNGGCPWCKSKFTE